MADVYQVTLCPVAKGTPPTRWRAYGSAGLTRSVESVDLEVRHGHYASGTIHRLNASGGEEVEVYSRPARSGLTIHFANH